MTNKSKQNRELVESILSEFTPGFEKKIIAKMEISIRIEEARKKKGWSKLDLAKQFNKKPSVITKWLSGSHNFTIDTLVEIEEILKINVLSIEEKQEKSDVQYISVPASVTVSPTRINNYCWDLIFGLDPTYIQSYKGETKSRA